LKIKITDKWAQLVEDDTLRQNSQKPYKVEFIFDETWDDFSKTAIFEAGSASIIVTLTDDCCIFPAECLKQGGVIPRVGVYGVRDAEHKATVWCKTSLVLYDVRLDLGQGSQRPDEIYTEIMAAIGDLSAAGFEGMTLAEIFREIWISISETATDEEVDKVLDATFGESGGGSNGHVEPEYLSETATDKEVDDILNDVFG